MGQTMKTRIQYAILVLLSLMALTACGQVATKPEAGVTSDSQVIYTIVDTGQEYCYEDGASIPCPTGGQVFYGQDAQYRGTQPSYTDNGDGTITDNVTGLMWQKDQGDKMTYAEAVARAETFDLAGYDDWRLPTIKELYSLILFSGTDVSGCNSADECEEAVPFVDTDYFEFEYGDTSAGERLIDAQYWSSNEYVGLTMGGDATVFGVNFADGRIKGYPRDIGPNSSPMLEFVRYVRGNLDYGINDFVDNGNGTVSDKATGLTWMQTDSGTGMVWEDALAYCESLDYAGFNDWHLPNIKELQSIVDYSRSPDTTNSGAIDPIFNVSTITNEASETDYPFYWSNTTHVNMRSGDSGTYVSFGRALGYMNSQWLDVHGAGAQRSDPKSGDPADWPTGHGPQGDAIRIYNYARCVRGGVSDEIFTGGEVDQFSGSDLMQPGTDTGQPDVPPQEAIDACSGASESDPCEFTAPVGTITGTCMQIEDQLACVPE